MDLAEASCDQGFKIGTKLRVSRVRGNPRQVAGSPLVQVVETPHPGHIHAVGHIAVHPVQDSLQFLPAGSLLGNEAIQISYHNICLRLTFR